MSMTLIERPDALPLIVQLLRQNNTLTDAHLVTIREARQRDHGPIERLLSRKGLANEWDIAEAYATHLGLPLFIPEAVNFNPESVRALGGQGESSVLSLLPEKLCRDQLIAPLAVRGDTLDVAFVRPNEMIVIEEVQLLTGLIVRPMITTLNLVERLLDLAYGQGQHHKDLLSSTEEFEEADEEDEAAHRSERDADMLLLDQPPPPGRDGRTIRMVNQVLEQAIRTGASDIHLEPFEDCCKVRLRIDGLLHEMPAPPMALFVPMVSRFKILAKMDIAEKRVPQDGAIALKSGEKRIDLRVNTVPTVYGEKMVMRLLDKAAIPLQLTGLGLSERQSRDLAEGIQMPHGLMLVTGPTGSGKSTTLYACLNMLNEADTNICTVEDPVEYKFKGMNQVQVKAQVGLTFASALRAFLRQDPDVIMVGEVRDPETAQICLRAALTGHFVLSTIHTNDSLAAVTRLQDMGIEPFLLSVSLRVLQAQRLLRRLCKECKQPYSCDPQTARRCGFEPDQPLYRAKGCPACRGTGYKGRVGVFEVIRITKELSTLIQNAAPIPQMRELAREQGMKLLGESAIEKVVQGVTSLEEALSVALAGQE